MIFRKGSIFLEHCSHLTAKGWDAALQGGPDDVVITCVVPVKETIPHAHDPPDIWKVVTDVRIEFLSLAQSLTSDPKLPLDCGSDDFILELVLTCQSAIVPSDEVA